MFPTLQRRSQRVATTTVALATAILIAVGVTGATADSETTNVAITPLTPVKTITTGASVAAGKSYTFVGSGGSTTVPTNALVIAVAVTVKGAAGGTLTLAPSGHPASASPTKISWPAGGTGGGTVKVNLGQSNKVVITNGGTGSATVGVKITGYSTQVTAAGINGTGGTNGQVLTNNGDGTVGWRTPPATPQLFKAHVTSTGQVEAGLIDAMRLEKGIYRVNFGRVMMGCAVTGSTGIMNGGFLMGTGVVSVEVNPTLVPVIVRIWNPATVQMVDSDFSLVAVC